MGRYAPGPAPLRHPAPLAAWLGGGRSTYSGDMTTIAEAPAGPTAAHSGGRPCLWLSYGQYVNRPCYLAAAWRRRVGTAPLRSLPMLYPAPLPPHAFALRPRYSQAAAFML